MRRAPLRGTRRCCRFAASAAPPARSPNSSSLAPASASCGAQLHASGSTGPHHHFQGDEAAACAASPACSPFSPPLPPSLLAAVRTISRQLPLADNFIDLLVTGQQTCSGDAWKVNMLRHAALCMHDVCACMQQAQTCIAYMQCRQHDWRIPRLARSPAHSPLAA